jgi:hypothetical protein
MRFSKKFWIWLIETQLDELCEHEEPRKLCNEFADIIGISLQAIQEIAGKDCVAPIIESRIKSNIERIPEIAYKYREKWLNYEGETAETGAGDR